MFSHSNTNSAVSRVIIRKLDWSVQRGAAEIRLLCFVQYYYSRIIRELFGNYSVEWSMVSLSQALRLVVTFPGGVAQFCNIITVVLNNRREKY